MNVHLQACVNQFAACVFVNLCVVQCFSCMCLHSSVCLCAVGFCLAVPTALLTAVDGLHLHSESRQLLPLLLHCCDSAPLAPARIAAVPVMFGYSWAGELVADIQTATTNTKLGPRTVSWRGLFLCGLPGSLGVHSSPRCLLFSVSHQMEGR